MEDEQKGRQAANDAWMFSLASGKWEEMKYTSDEVPRVCLSLLQQDMLTNSQAQPSLWCCTLHRGFSRAFWSPLQRLWHVSGSIVYVQQLSVLVVA